jgi:hypothetical protein
MVASLRSTVVVMARWNVWAFCVLGWLVGCGDDDGGDPGPPGALGGNAGSGDVNGAGKGGSLAGGGAGNNAGAAAQSGASVGGASSVGGANAGSAGTPISPGSGGSGTAGDGADAGNDNGAAGDGTDGPPLERVSTVPADKIDLLFVIDNSISMADKQEVFRNAVPLLVQRLVTPACLDAEGNPTGQLASAGGECASGGEPEFPPIRDIHVGVVSSSLGSNGGDLCDEPPGKNDHAHLLPSVRDGLESWNDSGFLAWDPDQTRNDPAGEGNPTVFVSAFQDMVVAAGETGCGYEAPLEAWYRFLIDPDPPSSVSLDATSQRTVASYPDQTILAQRQAFLRSDSLVGIAILSDENDCSLRDDGQAHLVGRSRTGSTIFYLPRSTSVCAEDPNDPCCTSCAASGTAAGCAELASDSECQKPAYTSEEDNLNLRCYEQKRRFGVDFLQPIQRYVDGLSSVQVTNRAGDLVANPLFVAAPGQLGRDLSRVFLLGILGVPWQDVADEESLDAPRTLKYLSHAELVAQDRWSLLIGEGGEAPGDTLLLETNLDRSTLGLSPHPLTGELPAPATETSLVNSINGHETKVSGFDLQYSCIFPLTTARDCTNLESCDCRVEDAEFNRALCNGTLQTHAKAYPPGRHLELLRAFGDLTGNSVVASICPKVTESPTPTVDPDYGYNPAVSALVDRMKSALAPTCLAEELEPDAEGRVSCELFEVTAPMGGSCAACDGAGRGPASAPGTSALLDQLGATRYCGDAGQPACDELCVCGIEQVEGAELESCQNDSAVAADLAGFCYIDAAAGLGNAELVRECPVGRKRRLRLVGQGVPRDGASTFVSCTDT